MTQIVATGNRSYAVVLADRRFTVNGVLVDEQDDERNKLIVLATRTARLGAAFCGLARLGAFETERWLSTLLLETSQAGSGTPDLESLCRRATNQFAQFRVRREADRCLWIVLAGFVSERAGISPTYAFISNADATADGWRAGPFHYEVFGPAREADKAYAMSLGAVRANSASVDRLKRIVDENRPPAAARGAAIRLLTQARRDPIEGGKIGDRCGAVV